MSFRSRSGDVWASPDLGILGLPVTGLGKMRRRANVSGFAWVSGLLFFDVRCLFIVLGWL